MAHITAIFKKGNRHLPSNYRPVSLTAIASKVMESLVRTALVTHMRDNGLFAAQQHGFVEERSCTTQLISTLDSWTKTLDEGQRFDAIFMDFMKAFDTVPRQRLLCKFRGYGIDGELLAWIESFINNRRQCVVINGQKSSWTDVISGIPQGSVLGPVLFVVYINDLPDEVTSNIILFADDTKVYRTITTTEDCRQLQSDLNNLQTWAKKWQMKFHPDKCSYAYRLRTHRLHIRDGVTRQRSTTDADTCREGLGSDGGRLTEIQRTRAASEVEGQQTPRNHPKNVPLHKYHLDTKVYSSCAEDYYGHTA